MDLGIVGSVGYLGRRLIYVLVRFRLEGNGSILAESNRIITELSSPRANQTDSGLGQLSWRVWVLNLGQFYFGLFWALFNFSDVFTLLYRPVPASRRPNAREAGPEKAGSTRARSRRVSKVSRLVYCLKSIKLM